MKKVIKASAAKDDAYRAADTILSTMKKLFDTMDSVSMDYPSFVEDNGLGELYDCLAEDIPAFQLAVNSKTLEY